MTKTNFWISLIFYIFLFSLGVFNILNAFNIISYARFILLVLLPIVVCAVFFYALFKRQKRLLLLGIIGLILFYLNLELPNLFALFLGLLFSFYALINALIYFIDYLIARKNHLDHILSNFCIALFHFLFGIALLLTPLTSSVYVFIITGIYIIIYALLGLLKTLRERFGHVFNITLALPAVLTIFIPFRLLTSFNKKDEMDDIYAEPIDEPAPLEIYIHTNSTGFDTIGHVDLAVDGIVYSYGNHDPSVAALFGTAGDGVLLISKRNPYLKYVLTRGTMIFNFKLELNDKDMKIVKNRIKKLMADSEPYYCAAQLAIQKGEEGKAVDYVSGVYLATDCKLYKFKKGPFKTYFAPSANCVKLSDYILRNSEIDLLKMEGVITPGTYLSFLYSLANKEESAVKEVLIYYHLGRKNSYKKSY